MSKEISALTIFSEVSAIEKIYIENFPNWRRIIDSGVKIYLNIDKENLEKELDDTDGSILGMWNHEAESAKKPEDLGSHFQFIEDTQSIVRTPLGIFILDVDLEKANDLSLKYGVQIFSAGELIDIQDFCIDHVFEKDAVVQCEDKSLKGYKYISKPFTKEVSNSTIIIDRYIFRNREHNLNIGVYNLIQYFDSFLPTTLDIPYHILIITESVTAPSYPSDSLRDKIVENITSKIKKLRGYEISVELLFVHSSTVHYDSIHLRRILKNNHFGKCDLGYANFSINSMGVVNGIMRWRNEFNLKVYYNSTLQLQYSNVLMEDILSTLKNLLKIKADAEKKLINGQNDRVYRLYIDGRDTTKIINRVLYSI